VSPLTGRAGDIVQLLRTVEETEAPGADDEP
jgi:hypothetical protein